MGRRKIEIQPITNERNRAVTFLKRKQGLFKKAYELGVLCSVDVAVIIFERRQGAEKLYQYCSGDVSTVVRKQLSFEGERNTQGPSDFNGSGKGGAGGPADDGDDDDDDGDADDDPPAASASAVSPTATTSRKRTDSLKGKSRQHTQPQPPERSDSASGRGGPKAEPEPDYRASLSVTSPTLPVSSDRTAPGTRASSAFGGPPPGSSSALPPASKRPRLSPSLPASYQLDITLGLPSSSYGSSGAGAFYGQASPYSAGGSGPPSAGGGGGSGVPTLRGASFPGLPAAYQSYAPQPSFHHQHAHAHQLPHAHAHQHPHQHQHPHHPAQHAARALPRISSSAHLPPSSSIAQDDLFAGVFGPGPVGAGPGGAAGNGQHAGGGGSGGGAGGGGGGSGGSGGGGGGGDWFEMLATGDGRGRRGSTDDLSPTRTGKRGRADGADG